MYSVPIAGPSGAGSARFCDLPLQRAESLTAEHASHESPAQGGRAARFASGRRIAASPLHPREQHIVTPSPLHPKSGLPASIWRFFRDNKKAIQELFKQVVRLAADAGMVGFALHALDGTKMQAACSMDSALHKNELLNGLSKLDSVVDESIAAIEATAEEASGFRMPEQLADPQQRKQAIQDGLAKLKAAGASHMSPHEPDARMMLSRNGSVMGYNSQVVVDHDSDLIVAQDVSTDANDHGKLVPMLDRVLETTDRVADETSADTGYWSGEQIDEAERRNYPVVVNVQKDSSGKGKLLKEHFRYVYVCPLTAEELTFWRVDRSGMAYTRRTYLCRRKDCPYREACTKDRKQGRTIKRSPHDDALDRQKRKQQSSDVARDALELRKEVVEHAFGNIKWCDGFRRFTAWGLEGARSQWALACTASNLRKLHAAWRRGEFVLRAA